jgi:hypothetical protein
LEGNDGVTTTGQIIPLVVGSISLLIRAVAFVASVWMTSEYLSLILVNKSRCDWAEHNIVGKWDMQGIKFIMMVEHMSLAVQGG